MGRTRLHGVENLREEDNFPWRHHLACAAGGDAAAQLGATLQDFVVARANRGSRIGGLASRAPKKNNYEY